MKIWIALLAAVSVGAWAQTPGKPKEDPNRVAVQNLQDAKSVLEAYAKKANVKIVVDQTIRGKVKALPENLTTEQALDFITKSVSGLEWRKAHLKKGAALPAEPILCSQVRTLIRFESTGLALLNASNQADVFTKQSNFVPSADFEGSPVYVVVNMKPSFFARGESNKAMRDQLAALSPDERNAIREELMKMWSEELMSMSPEEMEKKGIKIFTGSPEDLEKMGVKVDGDLNGAPPARIIIKKTPRDE